MNFKVVEFTFNPETGEGRAMAAEMIEGSPFGDTSISFTIDEQAAKKINAILQDQLDAVQNEIGE